MDPKLKQLFLLYHGGKATPRDFKDLAVGLVEGGARDANLVELAYVCEETVEDIKRPIERLLENSSFQPPETPVELVRELLTFYILKIASSSINPLEVLRLIQEKIFSPFSDLVGDGDNFGVKGLLECYSRMQKNVAISADDNSENSISFEANEVIGIQVVEECQRWGEGSVRGVGKVEELSQQSSPGFSHVEYSKNMHGKNHHFPGKDFGGFSPDIEDSFSPNSDPFKRPLGVTLIAGFYLMLGLSLFVNLVYPSISWKGFEVLNTERLPLERTYLFVIKTILYFSFGGSLLAGLRWSWWGVAFIHALILTLFTGAGIVDGFQYELSFVLTVLILSSGVLFYMFMPNFLLYFFRNSRGV